MQTDGWQPTQGAWKTWLENVTLILCLLQAFLTIRDRPTKAFGEVGQAGHKRVWDAYHAPRKRAFSQRVRRLQAWAETALPDAAMQSHPLALCHKRAQFLQSDDHLGAHRTSNLVDRLMQFLDRACFHGQYFPGTFESAESRGRALGLLWHFCPSSPETVKKYAGQACPAARLNGKRYADNWLENRLVSASMNGVEQDPQNPL